VACATVSDAANPQPDPGAAAALLDAAGAGAAALDGALTEALSRAAPAALAWALKDACYAAWTSSPTRAVRAAAALRMLSARAAGDDVAPLRALAFWTEGIAHLAEGRMDEAATALDAAHDAFVERADAQHAAETRVPKMIALAMQGRDDEAEAAGREALARFAAAGDERAAGKIELNLGTMATRRDRHADAAALYRRAAVRFARVGDMALSVMADLGLGQALTWQFETDEALRIHRRARMRAATHGLGLLEAQACVAIGRIELHRGRRAEALALLVEGCEHLERIGAAPQQRLEAEAALADGYAAVHLWPEAASIHDRLVATAEAAGAPGEAARARLERGLVRARLGGEAAAAEDLDAARLAFLGLGNEAAAAMAGLHQGRVSLRRGAIDAAAQAAAASRPVLQASGIRSWWLDARLLEAQVAAARGDLAVARALGASVLDEAADLPSIAGAARLMLAQAAAAAGDSEAARTHARAVLDAAESARAALPADELRSGIAAESEAAADLLVALALDAPQPDAVEVLSEMARGRSRSLALALAESPVLGDAALSERVRWTRERWREAAVAGEASGAAALDARLHALEAELLETHRRALAASGPARGGAAPAAVERPEDWCGLLDDATACVQFHRLGGRIAACVVTRQGGVRAFALPLPDLDARLQSLRFQLEAPRLAPAALSAQAGRLVERARHHLHALYRQLWAPLEAAIGGRPRVLLVPHRELHFLPWAALHDGAHWLVERHELIRVPRLGAAAVTAAAAGAPAPLARVVAAGVGGPALPSVAAELDAVAAAAGGSALVLRDGAATQAALRGRAADADVLHLACHGRFRDDSPDFSSLSLADGPLALHEIRRWPLRARLVVLSACETGASRLAPGDEAFGLVRGFMIAGAASVAATLWPVADAATAALMARFYAGLAAGEPVAAALRRAQCDAATVGGHPFEWAAWTLHARA
jgi:CHAT domain-containing protein